MLGPRFWVLLLPAALLAQKPATFFQPYFLGNVGVSYAVADFNGDGKQDVAIAGADLAVALGNGKGQFRTLPPLAYGLAQIVAGDFNGDGRQDLVVSVKNQLIFLAGNGDGTFSAQQVIGTFSVADLAAADLNGDGKLDLLVSSTTVLALLGNGDGTFQAPIATTAATTGPIAVADFNLDGIPDFAVTTQGLGVWTLQVLLGKGNGTFGAAVVTSPSGATSGFVVGNFTGHAAPDVAVAVATGVQVLIGKGNGAFTNGPLTACTPGTLIAGDFNGDGISDLANGTLGELAVYLNSGHGRFQVPAGAYQSQAADFTPALAVGVFRKPGALDIIVDGLYYRNRGNGKLDDPRVFATPYSSNYSVAVLAAGDFNGDGKTDLIVGGGDGTSNLTVSVFPGDGQGGFKPYIQTSLGSYTLYVAINALVTGDFNNDGKLDIAVSIGSTTSSSLLVLLGSGDGTFGPPSSLAATSPGYMAVGDFNHDGNLDLAVLDSDGIGIFLGNGDGTFTQGTAVPGAGGYQLIAADLTGNGNLDLVTPGQIFLGNGDGTFLQAPQLSVGGQAVASADFNGDGIPDLAISDSSDNIVLFYFGNGDGTFGPPSIYRPISGDSLLAGDFNHDGIPDLLIGAGTVEVLLGKGDGTFTLQTPQIAEIVLQSPYRPIIKADFNGDGKQDLGLVYGTAVINVPVVMAILNTSN